MKSNNINRYSPFVVILLKRLSFALIQGGKYMLTVYVEKVFQAVTVLFSLIFSENVEYRNFPCHLYKMWLFPWKTYKNSAHITSILFSSLKSLYASSYCLFLSHTHTHEQACLYMKWNPCLSVSAAINIFLCTPSVFTKPQVFGIPLKVKTPQKGVGVYEHFLE